MFKWIKIISRLSRQDDIIGTIESKVSGASAQMEKFAVESAKMLENLQMAKEEAYSEIDCFRNAIAELKKYMEGMEHKLSEDKSDMEKLSGEMEAYQLAIGKKVEEMRSATQEHLTLLNGQIEAYNSNISKLGEEIVRLGDSIAEFEKR